MCGLCGIVGSSLAPDRERVVRSMMGRLRHRGPDDEGLASGGGFVFGHRRLAIIDLEQGRQPMRSADGRFTLIFNGALYNYLELREELGATGIVFRTHSDTEVLLELLGQEGEAALDRALGMFAFALYDARTREVLLARDPFGIKPLYYTVTPSNELVFASEIKALLAHPEVVPRRSDHGLHQYLTLQLCLGDATLFEGIHKIEPGCLLRWHPAKGGRSRRYWDCDFSIDTDHTPSYFAATLAALIEDSVRLQLRSDVALGAQISGGLDSSLISTLAGRLSPTPLPVFHGRFAEAPGYDESSFARLAAVSVGAEYHEVVPTAEEFVKDLRRLIYLMDEPAAGPGLFPQYRVADLASRHVKVVLGGQGGDEVFGGYARYVVGYLEQALKGAIFETQEEGQHLVSLASIIPNLPLLRDYVPLMRDFWSRGLFDPMDARYFRLIDRLPDLEAVLEPELAHRGFHEEVFEVFRREFNHPQTVSYINKMTHFDLKTLLPALLQVEDRVTMAVGIESRVPLLDRRVVDLVTTMPPVLKFAGGRTKHVLKQIGANVLPREIVERKDKMGFPVPLREWMRGGRVRDFVADTLLATASRQRGIFRPDALERLIDSQTTFGRQLWGALCLELWHEIFLDGGAEPEREQDGGS